MKLRDKMNKNYTLIAIYVIVTASIIYCLSLVAKNAPSIFQTICGYLSWILKVLKPIVFGVVFAYLLDPIITFLDGKLHKLKIFRKRNSCRSIAVLITLTLLIFILLTVISLLVFNVTKQFKFADFDDIIILCNAYLKSLQDFYNSILTKLESLDFQSDEIQKYITQAVTYVVGLLQSFASGTVSSFTNLSSYLTTFIFGVIIGIYFLIDGAMIMKYTSKVFYALFPKKLNFYIRRLLDDADYVFSGYIRGQLSDAFVMMILISIALFLVGVKYAVVIGIFAGIGNLIPYCGPFVAYAGTILVCLLNGDWTRMIIGIIVLFIIQTVDGNIIGPKLLGQSIQIHPLLVIVSLIFGSSIGGLMGMLLAVPVGALLKVMFVRFIDNRFQTKLTKGDIEPNLAKEVAESEDKTPPPSPKKKKNQA